MNTNKNTNEPEFHKIEVQAKSFYERGCAYGRAPSTDKAKRDAPTHLAVPEVLPYGAHPQGPELPGGRHEAHSGIVPYPVVVAVGTLQPGFAAIEEPRPSGGAVTKTFPRDKVSTRDRDVIRRSIGVAGQGPLRALEVHPPSTNQPINHRTRHNETATKRPQANLKT